MASTAYPSLKGDLECEVLVRGARITGARCAYHLTKAGRDVAVLDKRDVAGGTHLTEEGYRV